MNDNNKEKKNITIDDLAIMVAGGFAGAKKDVELGFVAAKKDVELGFVAAKKEVELGFASAKKDLELFKLETNTHFNNIETDLKSVKNDLSELQDKVDDIHETVMSYDKRIEVLEDKVLA